MNGRIGCRKSEKGGSECRFNGPVIPFGAMVQYQPISAKDMSKLHQCGAKVFPGKFLGYVVYAGGIWNGDIMVAYIEELEEIDASELHARRLNAKEVLTPMKGDDLKIPVADGNPRRRSSSKTIHVNQGSS